MVHHVVAFSGRAAAMKNMAKRRGAAALALGLCAVVLLLGGQASSAFAFGSARGLPTSQGASVSQAAAWPAEGMTGAALPASERALPSLLASGAAAAFVVAAASALATSKAAAGSRRSAPKVVTLAFAPAAPQVPALLEPVVALAPPQIAAAPPAVTVTNLIDTRTCSCGQATCTCRCATGTCVCRSGWAAASGDPFLCIPMSQASTFAAGAATTASRPARTPCAVDRSSQWNARRLRRTARAAAASQSNESHGIGSSRQERRHFGAKIQRAACAEVQQPSFDPSTLRREIQRGLLNSRTSRTMGKQREATTKACSACGGACAGKLREDTRRSRSSFDDDLELGGLCLLAMWQ
eukprot:TRINITY_DN1908_c0_g1_i1.p1 TRINITY_DN1908_c0_g1~~TRINITY_DN1908_c0_g1_i1.p1  ORF type:complete len:353 (-),score=59.58 TRINITY_DN1908_c0_g1_i1:176-1234(-)